MASRPRPPVGLDWAAFILGMPSELLVETNDTYALFSPSFMRRTRGIPGG